MTNASSTAKPRANGVEDRPIRHGALANSIAFNLRRANNTALQAFARQLGRDYVRPGRFTILTLIAENPGLSQTALGRASGLDISTLTPALDDLVRRGFVKRQRLAHNRRSYALTLTASGVAFHREMARAATAFDRALARAVGPAEKAGLLRALRRIARAFGGVGA
jgi:DNA-binding MarR family transcriptional regulator